MHWYLACIIEFKMISDYFHISLMRELSSKMNQARRASWRRYIRDDSLKTQKRESGYRYKTPGLTR